MRAPIDSGEGGIRTSSAQHYEHPARRILDDWCAPKGSMIDVVRESWPDREDMFTCWNTKLDARSVRSMLCGQRLIPHRSANYGSRIDLILCSSGLRPWINGGDIQPKVFGSDHCPVYIDLHETADVPGKGLLNLRDMLNPPDRSPSTAPSYPTEPLRIAPEPPRFATKFFEEFSGRQKTLQSFFGGRSKPARKQSTDAGFVSPSPTPGPSESPAEERELELLPRPPSPPSAPTIDESLSTPFSLARAAFDSIDTPPTRPPSVPSRYEAPSSRKARPEVLPIDITGDAECMDEGSPKGRSNGKQIDHSAKNRSKAARPPVSGQTKLSTFFAQPQSTAKRKSPPPTPPPPKRQTSSPAGPRRPSVPSSPSRARTNENDDALIAQAIAEADEEKATKRAATNAEAAPIWSNLFAKKLPPLCTVHHQPCRDFSEQWTHKERRD